MSERKPRRKDGGTVQAQLERGTQRTVLWIPAQFARVGAVLDLRDRRMPGGWDCRWVVTRVYSDVVVMSHRTCEALVCLSWDYVREHNDDAPELLEGE